MAALWPEAAETLIQIPAKPDDPYEIWAVAKDAWHANARNYLYLDAYLGKQLSIRPYADLGIGSKIYYSAISLHTGMPAGIFGQVALFLSALALVLVFYTGFATFIRGKWPSGSQSKAGRSQVSSGRASIPAE